MDELRQCIDQLCENGGNEAELVQMLQNFPADATSCPVDMVKKLVKLVENYQGLRSHLNQMNLKVEKLGKSTGELELKAKQWEKAHQVVMKERDKLQADLNKMILCKDRLENLCRELQREKKKIEEDCNARIKAEEAKRKEFADKVNESINQLKQQISSNQEQQERLCEENIQLTDKLEKSLEVVKHHERALDKYEEREKTFNQLISAKDEERKILQQKYENAVRLMQEIHKGEIEKFKSQVDELLSQRKAIEESFVDQSKSYDQKFAQMGLLVTESQNTITKYKKEMGEITKFIKKLHDDSVKSKETISTLTSEKMQLQQSNDCIKKKLRTLENLCRRLQTDRRILVSLCKGNGLTEELERQLALVEADGQVDSEEQTAVVNGVAIPPLSIDSVDREATISNVRSTENIVPDEATDKEDSRWSSNIVGLDGPAVVLSEVSEKSENSSFLSKGDCTDSITSFLPPQITPENKDV